MNDNSTAFLVPSTTRFRDWEKSEETYLWNIFCKSLDNHCPNVSPQQQDLEIGKRVKKLISGIFSVNRWIITVLMFLYLCLSDTMKTTQSIPKKKRD